MSRTPQKQSGSRAYREAWRAVNLLIRSDGSWSGRERDVCYRNLGDGRFEDVSYVTGLDSAGDGRAWATLDWNGDGSLDLLLASRTGPRIQMLQNLPARAIVLELHGAQARSNFDAIGAAAELETSKGRKLRRIVQAGAGFLSQSSRRLHFALEPGETAVALSVEWPSGHIEKLDSVAPGNWTLREGNSKLEGLRRTPTPRDIPKPEPARSLWLQQPIPAPSMQGLPLGKMTLLNFWASWCPPCRQEMAEWTLAAKRFAAAGINVIVASVDEDKTKKPNAPFAVLHPGEREVATWNLFHRHLFDRRQDAGLPSSFLLDAQGRVIKVYKGIAPSATILADTSANQHPSLPFAGTWHGPQSSRGYVELATALAEHGLARESAAYFDKAIAANDASAEALNNYAGVLLELGDLDKAEALLLRTLSAYPRQLDALSNLGQLRLRQMQPGAARELFRQILRSEPDDAAAWHGLGSALFAIPDLDAAREALNKAIILDPDNADYRYSWAGLLAARGELAAALREFETIREAKPDSIDLANNLGILYAESGDPAKAEAEFRRALALQPSAPQAHLNLSTLLIRANRRTEARELLRRLLSLQPDNEKAKQALESLR